MKKNWVRRVVGTAICLAPVVLLVCSLLAGVRARPTQSSSVAWTACAALLVGLWNFWLSFVRPWLVSRRTDPETPVRHVSGIPMVGTILAAMAGLLAFGSRDTALVALFAVALDTGGLLWFPLATWRDSSLWDAPRAP